MIPILGAVGCGIAYLLYLKNAMENAQDSGDKKKSSLPEAVGEFTKEYVGNVQQNWELSPVEGIIDVLSGKSIIEEARENYEAAKSAPRRIWEQWT